MSEQPVFFVPHGGGPCFFMPDPAGHWTGMATFLRSIESSLPAIPSAILIVSGHWETRGFQLTSAEKPELIYDYYGFPEHTYALKYPVAGSPALAQKAAGLLKAAGLDAGTDAKRGLDHGVFIPLKVAFAGAQIPVVELSLDHSLDPGLHLKAGEALQALRADNVLIVATGMSFHNMRGYGDARFTEPSAAFDRWLCDILALEAEPRAEALKVWQQAPYARLCHPREEHLLPVMVAAGAASGTGKQVYHEQVLRTAISAYRFD